MPIQNDDDLARAVSKASSLMQEIQDYTKRDFAKKAELRFPRGHIRSAGDARKRLGFLENSPLKDNIAYTLMLADVQHWILVRTDLFGMAEQMVMKLQFFLLGSIIESVTKVYLHGRCGKNFGKRTAYMEDNGIISPELRKDVDWVWELRNKMHLFMLKDKEWASTDYTLANHNKVVRTFKELLDVLNDAAGIKKT